MFHDRGTYLLRWSQHWVFLNCDRLYGDISNRKRDSEREGRLSSKFLFIVAIFSAVAAAAIWAVFLRAIPVRTAFGSIAGKTFKPAGTYWQYPTGLDRGFRTATPIPIAEADVFELAIDGFEGPVFFSLNTVAAKAFDVGKKVQIQYRERVIHFVGKRIYVLDMSSNN
jgi:hypothetical protein